MKAHVNVAGNARHLSSIALQKKANATMTASKLQVVSFLDGCVKWQSSEKCCTLLTAANTSACKVQLQKHNESTSCSCDVYSLQCTLLLHAGKCGDSDFAGCMSVYIASMYSHSLSASVEAEQA